MAWVAGKGGCCSCSVCCWQQDWSGSSRGLEGSSLCHSSHTTPTLQIQQMKHFPQWALSPQFGVQEILLFQGHWWAEICHVSTHGSRAVSELPAWPMSGNSREAELSHSRKLVLFMSSVLSYPRKHKVLCLQGRSINSQSELQQNLCRERHIYRFKGHQKGVPNTAGKEALPSSVRLGKGSGTHWPCSRS